MNLAFWRKKDKGQLDTLSWNLMVAATDPDRCWELASTFRKTSVPGSVLTCETSFLMGSIVRDILRSIVAAEQQRQSVLSAESAYYKTFDDQSDEPLPPEMEAIYGKVRLGHVARIALAAYGEQNDMLLLTSAIFVNRIKGDPRMKYEVTPLFEERKATLSSAFAKVIK
jgi:hypothetical protein